MLGVLHPVPAVVLRQQAQPLGGGARAFGVGWVGDVDHHCIAHATPGAAVGEAFKAGGCKAHVRAIELQELLGEQLLCQQQWSAFGLPCSRCVSLLYPVYLSCHTLVAVGLLRPLCPPKRLHDPRRQWILGHLHTRRRIVTGQVKDIDIVVVGRGRRWGGGLGHRHRSGVQKRLHVLVTDACMIPCMNRICCAPTHRASSFPA